MTDEPPVRKTAYLTIRLPQDVSDKIKEMAQEQKRSYASQVWHLIELGLQAEGEKK